MRHAFFNLFIDDFCLADIDLIKPGFHICNLNLDQVVLAQKDKEFAAIIKNSELIIPDGIAVCLSYNLLFRPQGMPKISKIAGIDLAEKLIDRSKRLALLGGSEEVISKLRHKYLDKLVFAENGFFQLGQKDDIVKNLLETDPDLLLVALGAPLQEQFINAYRDLFCNMVVMGVGGAFDVWSGKLKRAPKWMIFVGLEWLFRLVQEPYRLKRFFFSVCRYVFLVASSLFGERS